MGGPLFRLCKQPGRALPAGSWRLCLAAALVTLGLLLAPSAAQARSPVLLSGGIDHGHLTAQWTLPSGVKAIVVEISTTPATGPSGYFRQDGLITIAVLEDNQTALTADDCGDCVLGAGKTYYIHLAGEDKTYRACPPRAWSDVMKLTVAPDGQSVVAEDVGGGSQPCPKSAGRGGTTKGGGSSGQVAPFFRVFSARRSQRVGNLYVTAALSEKGTLSAKATVNVPGGSKLIRFKPVKRSVGARVRTKLRLKLSKSALRTVRRALLRGKRLTAKITVTAIDKDGNGRIQREKVRLKP